MPSTAYAFHRRSRPAALPSIGYRGFAVAPMTLRAPSRNLVYNPGCRVETLLVSKGVMGFLGDLRGRNSKSPPNPLGLRSTSPSPKTSLFEGGGPPAGGGRSLRASRPYNPSHALSKPLIQPRVQGRNPARFNGGYGVPRGFKGGSKPSAPCGRLSEAEHPKRKGATLLRPLSAVNRNRPGNSHSRASAPCDFRFPPCFFPHSGRMASIPLIP